MKPTEQIFPLSDRLIILLSFFGLFFISKANFLLFHSIVEIYSIAIAFLVFALAWNCRKIIDCNYLLFLGMAYLYVGMLDGLHLLAYKGMGVFPDSEANLPTQLWIAARYFEAFSLLGALYYLNRPVAPMRLVFGLGSIFALLVASIFWWEIFPVCFVGGQGLTPFKIWSEYLISIVLLIAFGIMLKHRRELDERTSIYVIIAILTTVGAELSFTFYVSVYGLSNLLGHYLKILSFYLIYKAIAENGLQRPFTVLFRNLKKNEDELRASHAMLEKEIAEKQQAEKEKDKLIGELKTALDTVKTLKGLIPICASCKKIRNDSGYWQQIETFVKEHSDASFSHGFCPDCLKKMYPDLYEEMVRKKMIGLAGESEQET